MLKLNHERTNRMNSLALMPLGMMLLVLITLFSCSSSSKTSNRNWNLADIYNPLSTSLHPVYKVHHNSASSSILYVKIYTSELIFQPISIDGALTSKLSIRCELYETERDSSWLVDSSKYEFAIKQVNVGEKFLTQLPLNMEEGKTYLLRIETRDQIKKSYSLNFIDVDKRSLGGHQSFNLSSAKGMPFFTDVTFPQQAYKLGYPSYTADTLYISYYSDPFPAPDPFLPIMSDNSYLRIPDSLWMVDYVNNTVFQFSYPGVFHFSFDTNQASGYTILNETRGFPKTRTPEQLIDPLVYILSKPEFEDLKKAKNPKLAVDNFWIDAAGGVGRGKELIRIYYNRVYFANYYFTNNRPGWKTDRGMIYVVYGPPQKLRKTARTETWIYELKDKNQEIKFTFTYQPNLYNVKHYRLDRSQNHEWRWKEAVDSWRRGDIFLMD